MKGGQPRPSPGLFHNARCFKSDSRRHADTAVRAPGAAAHEFGCERRWLWQRLNMAKYSASQAKAAMRFLPHWARKGSVISRTYQFRDFATAMEFVKAVAELA